MKRQTRCPWCGRLVVVELGADGRVAKSSHELPLCKGYGTLMKSIGAEQIGHQEIAVEPDH
jgi:hypothetical protein